MKKSSLLATAIISVALTNVAYAEAEKKTANEELSNVRIEISKQILENKLDQAKLDGLQKKQEIQIIQNNLDGVSSSTSSTSSSLNNQQQNVDNTFKFNEAINEEDILSKDKNWKQTVGFIYQDDLVLTTEPKKDSSVISDLTDSKDIDFQAMLEQVASESKGKVSENESIGVNDSLNNLNEFKLMNVELSKLNISDSEKSGAIKVNYLTNNGYQKIKGAKIINVVEGKTFNVKGKVDFEIIAINDNGIQYKNLTSGKTEIATK